MGEWMAISEVCDWTAVWSWTALFAYVWYIHQGKTFVGQCLDYWCCSSQKCITTSEVIRAELAFCLVSPDWNRGRQVLMTTLICHFDAPPTLWMGPYLVVQFIFFFWQYLLIIFLHCLNWIGLYWTKCIKLNKKSTYHYVALTAL